MRAIAVGIAYTIPFIIFVLIPASLEPIFLAVYIFIILVSMAMPLRRAELSTERISNIYKGLAGAVVGLLIISLYIEFLFGLLKEDATRMTAATWILASLIFPTASMLSVSRLGAFLGNDGMDGLKNRDDLGTGFQHFALEYCTLHWFRHGNNFLLSLVSLTMYLYGWLLLGIPFLFYSVALLVLLNMLLGTLSRRLLAPFEPDQVIARMESIYPTRTLRTNLRRPPRPVLIVIFGFLTFAGYVLLVTNAFVGFNLAVFSMLVIVYAASLWFYAWTSNTQPPKA